MDKLRELIAKWNENAKGSSIAWAWRDRAADLEALLPALDSALGERQAQSSAVSNWGLSEYIPVLPPEPPIAPTERLRVLAEQLVFKHCYKDHFFGWRWNNLPSPTQFIFEIVDCVAAHEAQQAERIADLSNLRKGGQAVTLEANRPCPEPQQPSKSALDLVDKVFGVLGHGTSRDLGPGAVLVDQYVADRLAQAQRKAVAQAKVDAPLTLPGEGGDIVRTEKVSIAEAERRLMNQHDTILRLMRDLAAIASVTKP